LSRILVSGIYNYSCVLMQAKLSRSIFIFLFILAGIVSIAIFIFLPETLRTIAGNGSVKLSGIHQPVWRTLRGDPKQVCESERPVSCPTVTWRMFYEPLLLLKEVEILLPLIYGGYMYAIWQVATTTQSVHFTETFGMTEIQIGFSYISNGEYAFH
jgi:hypothetical protein